MVLDPRLFSGSRHCYIAKKAALLIMGIAQSIFNCLEGQDKVIPYLLIFLALELLFINVRENENIRGIVIFGFDFIISAFADDASFLTKDLASVGHLCMII